MYLIYLIKSKLLLPEKEENCQIKMSFKINAQFATHLPVAINCTDDDKFCDGSM